MTRPAARKSADRRPVMVVEDDDGFRQELEWHLRRRGFDVAAFGNAVQAMEQLRWGLRPCLILLDLRMSIMTGWEFRDEQRKDPAVASIPVIAMTTGNWKPSDVRTFTERLEKPFRLGDLATLLDRYCKFAGVAGGAVEPPPVLVVDDNPDILSGVEELLVAHGYRVLTARNGREALDVARTGRPGLILLDLAMPEMDGWQFLNRRAAEPEISDIPVVAMSAYARDNQGLVGVRAVMSKPVDPAQLVDAVRRYVGGR